MCRPSFQESWGLDIYFSLWKSLKLCPPFWKLMLLIPGPPRLGELSVEDLCRYMCLSGWFCGCHINRVSVTRYQHFSTSFCHEIWMLNVKTLIIFINAFLFCFPYVRILIWCSAWTVCKQTELHMNFTLGEEGIAMVFQKYRGS